VTPDLADRLAAALGPRVAVGWPHPRAAPATPEEMTAVARAIPTRRAEFAAGRRAAHAALRRLGTPVVPIPMGADRAPIWPDGIAGSITHTGQIALAAVVRTRDSRALGIDAEAARPLTPPVAARVTTQADDMDPADPLAATAIFSAKEATYKALYPLTGQVWGFDAVSIRLGRDGFTATLARPAGPFPAGTGLCGILIRTPSIIVTALLVPR